MSSSSMNVIIVGNGVAGITAARTIKEKNPKAKVSIYTDESHHYYPRPTCSLKSGTMRRESTSI
jgi:NADH dehydrogenase FAD-containing subunit